MGIGIWGCYLPNDKRVTVAARQVCATTQATYNAERRVRAALELARQAAGEIQKAIDDPRPNISHNDVMADMDADVAALMPERKPAARQHA